MEPLSLLPPVCPRIPILNISVHRGGSPLDTRSHQRPKCHSTDVRPSPIAPALVNSNTIQTAELPGMCAPCYIMPPSRRFNLQCHKRLEIVATLDLLHLVFRQLHVKKPIKVSVIHTKYDPTYFLQMVRLSRNPNAYFFHQGVWCLGVFFWLSKAKPAS